MHKGICLTLGILVFIWLAAACNTSSLELTDQVELECTNDDDCPGQEICDTLNGICIVPAWADGDEEAEADGDEDFEEEVEAEQEESSHPCEDAPCIDLPFRLAFENVLPGDIVTRELVITNVGGADLTITGYDLCPDEACPGFSVDTGATNPSLPLTLAPAEPVVWRVSFARVDLQEVRGELWIESTDVTSNRSLVALSATLHGHAELTIEPDSLEFPETAVSSRSVLSFSLINRATAPDDTRPIEINSIETDFPFVLEAPEEGDSRCSVLLGGDPVYMEPDDSLTCNVAFTPAVSGMHTGSIIVSYNAGIGEQSLTADLSGMAVKPVLKLTTPSFCGDTSFGVVPIGESRSEALTLINATPRDETISISNIRVITSSSPFSVRYLTSDMMADNPPLRPPLDLAQGESVTLFVLFAPNQAANFNNHQLAIYSSISQQPIIVDLCGQGIRGQGQISGVALGLPAVGDDLTIAGLPALAPIVGASVSIEGLPYQTTTDSRGAFTFKLNDGETGDFVVRIDGSHSNGTLYSLKRIDATVVAGKTADVVALMGRVDETNALPIWVDRGNGIELPLDGRYNLPDSGLADFEIRFDASPLSPPFGQGDFIAASRVRGLDLPQAIPPGNGITADPENVYRFSPTGFSFGSFPARLRLPNASGLAIGETAGFYMLGGDPPLLRRAMMLRAEGEPHSPYGSVLVSTAGGGIDHFGVVSEGEILADSVGFVGVATGLPYTVSGSLRFADGTTQPGLSVMLHAPGLTQTTTCDTLGHYRFEIDGVAGQTVLIAAHGGSLHESLRYQSATIPAVGNDLVVPSLILPTVNYVSRIAGIVRDFDGSTVAEAVVTARYIAPQNADEDPDNDDPSADRELMETTTNEGGFYLLDGLPAISEGAIALVATHPEVARRSALRALLPSPGVTTAINLILQDADDQPPAIVGTYPAPSGYGVPETARIIVAFSEAIDEATLVADEAVAEPTIRLVDDTGEFVPVAHIYDPRGNWLVVWPVDGVTGAQAALQLGRSYSFFLANGLQDPAGNGLATFGEELPEGFAARIDFMTDSPDCSSQNPCILSTYDWQTGTCTEEQREDGTPCADNNLCDGAESCQDGSCVEGPALNCDDGNYCTNDSCNPSTGCVHAWAEEGLVCGPADNACTGPDLCHDGLCVEGLVIDCNDNNPCTVDTCDDNNGCDNTPIDDGYPCGWQLHCIGGQCVPEK